MKRSWWSLLAGCGVMIGVGMSSTVLGSDARRELQLPTPAYQYTADELPAHFRAPAAVAFDNTPEGNPLTNAGVTLGRVLFYDTRLSASGTVSCGSCHLQSRAFTDGRKFAVGHQGGVTDRNSMSLVNLRYSKAGKFWDERADTLEEQVLMPLQNRVEMGHELPQIESIVRSDERYGVLFAEAFGETEVSAERIARGLAQFLRSLVSYRSKYDTGMSSAKSADEEFSNFTTEENLGKRLFLEKCAICHRDGRGQQAAFFNMFRSLNNGIDATADVVDAGNGDVTMVPADIGLFKPSELRNVEFTGPYMHDGRFVTLEEVVEHYSTGVKRHPNVSGFVFRMQFRPEEKRALVAFLKTLSDREFLTDLRYADPWSPREEKNVAPVTTKIETVVAIASPTDAIEAKLSQEEIQRRIEERTGLPIGATVTYLGGLDQNGDGQLTREETKGLAELLYQNGPPARFDRRRFSARDLRTNRGGEAPPQMMTYDSNRDGTLDAGEMSSARPGVLEAADLNGDALLTIDEARKFETIERFLTAQNNDRDRSRLNRLIESLKVGAETSDDVRNSLLKAQKNLLKKRQELDANIAGQLEALLGEEGYARFQEVLLDEQDAQELLGRAGGITAESVQSQIFEFDENQDGLLDAQEQEALGAILDETPGGFGTPRLPLPSMQQFTQRMMMLDRDRDGKVSVAELPERLGHLLSQGDIDQDRGLTRKEVEDALRKRGFERFVAEGVYIGGGFVDAFTDSERLLKDLGIPEEKQSEGVLLIDEHEQQIQSSIQKIVQEEYRQIRIALTAGGQRSETSLKKPTRPTP